MQRLATAVLIVASLWVPAETDAAQTPNLPEGIPAGSVPAKATGAEDGEKLLVELDGENDVVRFLGADAPEADNGGNPECYFKESRDRLSKMLKGRTVYLEQETSDKDGKDRLLRYVWFVGKSDGKAYLAQEEMLREGFLIFKAEEEDDRYEERLRDAQKDAKADDAGLWGECGGGHVAVTPVPELGELGDPAPIGTTLNIEGQDITVLSAYPATEYGFSTPKGGYIYVVIEVQITNVDAAKEDHDYGADRFAAVDLDTGVDFDNVFVVADGILDTGNLSPGQYVSGTVVLEVQETSNRVRIKYDANRSGGGEIYWLVEY